MNPEAVVGKRVHLSRYKPPFFWRGQILSGRVTRFLRADAYLDSVLYLVELDTEFTFKPAGRDVFAERKDHPMRVTTRTVVVEIRRVELLEETIQGIVHADNSAPLLYCTRNEKVLSKHEMNVDRDLIALYPVFFEIVEPIGFDPAEAVGKRVQLDTLLEWDLIFPQGVITRLLNPDMRTPHVSYLVELDSPMTFESNEEKSIFGRKQSRKSITTKHIVVEIRNVVAIKEELNGHVLSELTAPILHSVRIEKVLSSAKVELRDSDFTLGPGRIRIVD